MSTPSTSTSCCGAAEGATLVPLGDVFACADGAAVVDEAGGALAFAAAAPWLPKILDIIEPNMLIDKLR